MSNTKTWLYHKEHGAKLFENCDEYELYEDGWRDSPELLEEEPPLIDALILMFTSDAECLSREELVLIGDEMGLKFTHNMKEQTMIDKITEALNGNDQATD